MWTKLSALVIAIAISGFVVYSAEACNKGGGCGMGGGCFGGGGFGGGCGCFGGGFNQNNCGCFGGGYNQNNCGCFGGGFQQNYGYQGYNNQGCGCYGGGMMVQPVQQGTVPPPVTDKKLASEQLPAPASGGIILLQMNPR